MRRSLTLLTLSLPSVAAAQATVPTLRLEHTLPGRAPQFGQIGAAAIAADGAAVIADAANDVVYRFRPDGTLRDSLGRKGAGPGEFRSIAGIAVSPAGDVVLADILLRRLVKWSAAGQSTGQVPLANDVPVSITGWGRGAQLVVTDFVRTIRVIDAPGDILSRTVATIPTVMANSMDGSRGCDLCPLVILRSGNVLMATSRDSAFRLTEFAATGAEIRRWVRPPVAPRPRSGEEVATIAARVMRGPGRGGNSPEGAPPPVDRERFRFPPRINALAQDGAGRTWVLANHITAPRPVFDLFDSSARFIGSVIPTKSIQNFKVAGSVLLGWGENPDGEAAAWIYRIGP